MFYLIRFGDVKVAETQNHESRPVLIVRHNVLPVLRHSGLPESIWSLCMCQIIIFICKAFSTNVKKDTCLMDISTERHCSCTVLLPDRGK